MLVREVRRWFWDGSLRVRVQRVRIWRLGEMEKGRGDGMGEVWFWTGISWPGFLVWGGISKLGY